MKPKWHRVALWVVIVFVVVAFNVYLGLRNTSQQDNVRAPNTSPHSR